MGERTPLRLGGARGFRWGPLPPEVEASLPAWLDGEVAVGKGDEGVEVLKPGRVWRVGDLVLKRYPPPSGLARLQGSPALRAGDLHDRLQPLRTPRTLLAVEREDRTGLLVSEYIDGRFLGALWDDDPAGREAFPAFMAEMHAQGVLHGDLNMRNMLWSGEEWVLIDLDGIVRGPRSLARKRLISAQWARILGTLRDRPGSRELFDAYVAIARPSWDPEQFWEQASSRGRRFAAVWDEQRARRARSAAPGPGTEAGH